MERKTQPARGMRDFLPEDVRRREFVIDVIARVYRRYGFEPLETPAVENIETLLGKYGEEGNKLIFKILRRGEHESSGEADLALRYDLTVPFARVVAEHRGRLPKFFKRYQIQPVWRADRPARGRFREFYQCDVDIIGSTSMVVEAELCSAVSDVLGELGFNEFAIRLNHRALLGALLETAGVPAALHDAAVIALDKLDKIGPEGVQREMATRGVPADAASRLLAEFVQDVGTDAAADANERRLAMIAAFVGSHPGGRDAVTQLREIVALCDANAASGHLRVDPVLARGLSYYTGAIMEIAVADLAGSLGGGGRYDGLVGMFSGEQVPACGFSLGLERILVVMGERNMFPENVTRAAADVLMTLFEGEPITDALSVAATLREGGLRVDVYPEPDKLGKQFKYATARGIRFVAIAGSDEREKGAVAIKDLTTGEQHVYDRSAAAEQIRSQLTAGSGQ